MEDQELTNLGKKVISKLDRKESLNFSDLETVRCIQNSATDRHAVGIIIWVAICFLISLIIQIVKWTKGLYSEDVNSVIYSIWLFSVVLICVIPDFGLEKIRARMNCRSCYRKIGDSKQRLDSLIKDGICPHCDVQYIEDEIGKSNKT